MNEQEIALIENYLTGKLAFDDRIKFENRLSLDSDFAQLHTEEKMIFDSIKDQGADEFFSVLREVTEGSEKDSRIVPFWKRRIVQGVAAIGLVLISAFLFLQQDKEAHALYEEYYEVYPFLLAQRNTNAAVQQDLIIAYEKQEWERVMLLLADVDGEVLPKPMKDIYTAIAELELNNSQTALAILMTYSNQPTKQVYQELIEWYTALAYLKEKNKASAKRTLQSLKLKLSSGSPLLHKVDDLLSEL